MYTMCFTGPRPVKLFGYDREKYIPVHNVLVQAILKTYEAGINEGSSNPRPTNVVRG